MEGVEKEVLMCTIGSWTTAGSQAVPDSGRRSKLFSDGKVIVISHRLSVEGAFAV